METLKATFSSRKDEINKLLTTMMYFEKTETDKEDGVSKFNRFFSDNEGHEVLSYQELINILKSNVSLMIYNLIEYTVGNLMDTIYIKIRNERLSYTEINDEIKTIWRKINLNSIKDPSSNHNTIIKKNEELINAIINKATIELNYKDTISGGNLDGEIIQRTFSEHGLHVKTSSKNYRPDILKNIKNYRNELAHGAVSFVEALREKSISDISSYNTITTSFLDELIYEVEKYIKDEKYKSAMS